jgi:uncharacterized protein YbjT (DUF2867 family)
VKSSYDLHTHTTSGFANGQCENALLASRATTLVIFVRGMSTPQPKDTEVMRIAVTTPTGHVGQHLVRTLLRAGVRPLVLTRDPQNLDPRVRDAVDAEVIDQFDADSVVAATVGVDALYWVDPPPPGPDPLADYALATDAVTRAVAENGIGRVVFQSSVGAEKRRGVGEIDGLGATEVALNDTAAAVIHLRCGYFFTNLEMQIDDIRAGLLRVIVPVDRPMPWVAPRDIAEVAATRLLAPRWVGTQVQAVHGPADLSWVDVVTAVVEATGVSLAVEQVPDEAMRAGLAGAGLPEALVESIMGMSTGMRENFVPEQPRSLPSTTPTTLGSWAYEVLRPQLRRG